MMVGQIVGLYKKSDRHAVAIRIGCPEIQKSVTLFRVGIARLKAPYAAFLKGEAEASRSPVDFGVKFVLGGIEEGFVVGVQISIVGIYAPVVVGYETGLQLKPLLTNSPTFMFFGRPSMRCTWIMSFPSI